MNSLHVACSQNEPLALYILQKREELVAKKEGVFHIDRTNKSSGMSGQFGSSTKDWYSGWSSMKTLVTKGLVVRSSCPAK